jgi:hypothetical protein
MSFSLKITFSGICAFFPITDSDDESGTFVVMPGLEGARNALDDEPLCPHNCYLSSSIQQLPNHPRISLKGKRLVFHLDYVCPPRVTDLPQEAIGMQQLFGNYCIVNPGIFSRRSPPRPSFVMTQVLLPPGAFCASIDPLWQIGALPGGGGSDIHGSIAHEVVFFVAELDRAWISVHNLDGSRPVPDAIELLQKDGRVELTIENTCEELQLLAPKEKVFRDRDFKWYYELLDDSIKGTIKGNLGISDLPIPRHQYAHVGGDHDCFPAKAGYQTLLSEKAFEREFFEDYSSKTLKKNGSTEGLT